MLQHRKDFCQSFLALKPGNNQLEHADRSAALSFPELRIRVQSFEHVEGLCGIVELAHLVAVVGNQVQ